MLSTIMWPSWSSLFRGEVTFAEVGELFSGLFRGLVEHEYFVDVWQAITHPAKGFAIPALVILAALSIVLAFHGKKLLPVVKPLAFFAFGFMLGVSVIAPLLTDAAFDIFPWVIGLVVGVLLMLFSKSLYLIAYIAAFAYASYMIFMGGQLLPETVVGFTRGNMILSLCAVCVTIVLVFLLRKPIEILGTAALGGYLTSLCLEGLLFEIFSLGKIAAVSIIVMILVALFGAFRQFRGKRAKKAKKVKAPKKK